MSDQTAPEPTMEEILASIRRIISEDDAPQGEGAVAAATEADAHDEFDAETVEAADESQSAPREETQAQQPEPESSQPEPEVFEPEPEVFERDPEPVRTEALPPRQEPLVSREAASAAASAFGQLTAAVTQPRAPSPTLEDLAREMLAPMLRRWLDENLPAVVQAAVRDEVERISRGRVG